MREILFRGKTDKGKWIEGNYFYDPDLEVAEITGFNYEATSEGLQREPFDEIVIPETVGQFTGLTDKNGKKIFEGDIIHSLYANCPQNEHIEKVTFFDGCFTAESASGGRYARIAGQNSPKHFTFDKSVYMIECEVIGNIHDNPELLKGGASE